MRVARKERRTSADRASHPISVTLNTGLAMFEARLYDDAVIFFLNAININPTNILGYINLGRTYTRLKRYKDAVQAYRDGLSINPNSTILLQALGNLLSQLKRHKEACEVYEQLVRVRRHDYMAHRLLASAYIHAGRPRESIAAFVAAMSLVPRYVPSFLNPTIESSSPAV